MEIRGISWKVRGEGREGRKEINGSSFSMYYIEDTVGREKREQGRWGNSNAT